MLTPLLAQHPRRICVGRKLTKPESDLKIIEINIQLPIEFLGNPSIQNDEQFRKREGNKSMLVLASSLNNGVFPSKIVSDYRASTESPVLT